MPVVGHVMTTTYQPSNNSWSVRCHCGWAFSADYARPDQDPYFLCTRQALAHKLAHCEDRQVLDLCTREIMRFGTNKQIKGVEAALKRFRKEGS